MAAAPSLSIARIFGVSRNWNTIRNNAQTSPAADATTRKAAEAVEGDCRGGRQGIRRLRADRRQHLRSTRAGRMAIGWAIAVGYCTHQVLRRHGGCGGVLAFHLADIQDLQ